MRKIVLVSFADKRFSNSLKRLEENTRPFNFTERYFYTERNALNREYWKHLKPWLYRRGYGYWSWKSSIVKEHLDNLEENDILFWSDAGVYWNALETAINRFNEYIEMLDESGDFLTFQQPTIEQEWTKGDVLETLGVYDNEQICKSNQLWAGCFCVKKTKESCELIDKWVELSDLKKELITDKRSRKTNKKGFYEHRHDQSIFSVLIKSIPHIEISWNEVQVSDGNWSSMNMFPIQGRRYKEKERSKLDILKNKLLRPWRELLHLYFNYLRQYDYQGRYHW